MQPELGKRDPTFVVLSYGYVLTSKYVWDTLKVRKAVDIIYLSSNDSIKREKSRFFYVIF